MPKSFGPFDAEGYAPVADRIALFYSQHPRGRIITDLVRRTRCEVVFRASVFRSELAATPAATGWASEREGDGDINTVACLENTETSAIGRALANLGFTASRQRPSAEEMAKVTRARRGVMTAISKASEPDLASRSGARGRGGAQLDDVLELVSRAERRGLSKARADSIRARLAVSDVTGRTLSKIENKVRGLMLAAREDREVAAQLPPPAATSDKPTVRSGQSAGTGEDTPAV